MTWSIFLEILQAVCLGFVHIPDIGPIPFQVIEQKLVQRCETHIEAQSCKASYGRGPEKNIESLTAVIPTLDPPPYV